MLLKWKSGVLALIAVSCQASAPSKPHYAVESEDLSEYGAPNRALFDDELGGINVDGSAAFEPQHSTLLSRRILEARTVMVCQIQTITEERAGEITRARLEFRGHGRFLSSSGYAECPSISVSSQSYSYLIIHHSSDVLIGKNIVLFLKEFNESGRVVLHWHGEPDTPWIRDEVTRIGSPIH